MLETVEIGKNEEIVIAELVIIVCVLFIEKVEASIFYRRKTFLSTEIRGTKFNL